MAFRVSKVTGQPGARNIELRKVPGKMYGFNLCKDVYNDIHYIDCVFTNSSADCAGMKPDDIVVAVNKQRLSNMKLTDTVERIYSRQDKVQLLVVRPWAFQQFIMTYNLANLNSGREPDHIRSRTSVRDEPENVTSRQVRVHRARERSRHDVNDNFEPEIKNQNRNDVQRPRQRKYRDVSPDKAHVTITNIEDRRSRTGDKTDRYTARMKSDNNERTNRRSLSPSKHDVTRRRRDEMNKFIGSRQSLQNDKLSQKDRFRVSVSEERMERSKRTLEKNFKKESVQHSTKVTPERLIFSRDSREKDKDSLGIQEEEKGSNHTVAIQTEHLSRPSDKVDSLERSSHDRKVKAQHRSPRIANSQAKLDSKSVCHLNQQEVEALICLERACYSTNIIKKPNTGFECRVCYTWRPPSKGVCLLECGHVFCKACVLELIQINPGLEIKCPKSLCKEHLMYHELKQFLTPSAFKRHFNWTENIEE